MKSIVIFLCCLALTPLARAEDQNKNKKKGQQQQGQQATGGQKGQLHTNTPLHTNTKLQTSHGVSKTTLHQNNLPVQHTKNVTINKTVNKYQIHNYNNFHARMNPAIASVRFNGNYHIVGSERWGSNYVVFANYHPVWHDQFWWHSHYNNVVLIGGGWYYWNAGYWAPAWGYDSGAAYYAFDGPIYSPRADIPPDQVVASVQSTLQEQGYYHADVDGLLGPLTRAALADYQRDHGLEITSAVDEPTISSLGIS